MTTMLHTEPSSAMLATLAACPKDGPFVALNLNRYRVRAVYPDGTPEADVSGRKAYGRYGLVAVPAILATGGQVLWTADATEVVIGCDHEGYDEVVAVWYPSRAAFLRLEEYPGYREAFELHRRAAVEHASLLFFRAGPKPELSIGF